ncbi:thiamine pyrophosphate-dependent enzyme [Micromonospora cathayae]|uniref:Thiamine pyrophosphate-dependent enzyme n=1 Tax=Micromonospora cathayae TaxID=3028804 RepID=A0ABY7ZNV5_9ACTN|nr:thiamine pyrophosphate-dependent enzyme [Micromonospora sp. HUAS 3]WDZ84681.1 thiamine pyrophosphate-dependent enzyme [Micromonospora sp. HUAS 3]
METIDEHLVRRLTGWSAGAPLPADPSPDVAVDPALLLAYLDAQVQSRHLDLALRWLQSKREGFYTIGSSGHESNAAVALALRPTDPALLHYRSGGFYAARAGQVPGSTPVADVLHSAAASRQDPISGGRHKVFGHRALNVIPQTSTIASHLPRAMGLAFALDRGTAADTGYPADAVVVCSFGDASANHSTAAGALNAVGYTAHQGLPVPLLFVCEDNGIGISTRSPRGWVRRMLSALPGLDYAYADGTDPAGLLATATEVVRQVRTGRRPAVLHLGTVRFMGHAGSDAELAYRSQAEILADYARDPILATAAVLARRGILDPAGTLERYEHARKLVMEQAESLLGRVGRLDSPAAVTEPLTARRVTEVSGAAARRPGTGRERVYGDRPPESRGPLTLAQSINAALHDALLTWPQAQVFGEDVARKGGVYGVTRGLRKAFGAGRVFDTLLDEQTILGVALGGALAGTLPIPEIQYLAYLHNAEDQLRGEAASLRFFSAGQYANGMVVRIAGLAYQKGFGGHFHNDNSVAVLRDIPGLVLAVASHPATAPALLRQCLALAEQEGRVCVFLEPIALYHTRDLHTDGDGRWLARYPEPADWASAETPLGQVRTVRAGTDLALVTFGNGVPMSLRVADTLAREGVEARVIDLQWLAPLPAAGLRAALDGISRVLVVDETRVSGGVAEAVVAALVDAGFPGRIARVNSVDSYVPLGPAADQVLLGEPDILAAARRV